MDQVQDQKIHPFAQFLLMLRLVPNQTSFRKLLFLLDQIPVPKPRTFYHDLKPGYPERIQGKTSIRGSVVLKEDEARTVDLNLKNVGLERPDP